MNIWPIIGLILTVIGIILTIVTALTGSIDRKIDEKIKNPEFMKQVASQLRFPFIVFDDDENVLYNSETEPYIEAPKVLKEKGEVKEVVITGKRFLSAAPILQALDGKIQFHDPERIGQASWRYKAFHYEYAVASKEEGRPADRFKLEVIP